MDRLRLPSVFNCFICSQPFSPRHTFNKGGKVPLVLNCGHSVCDSCVTRLLNKPGDELTCQICNSVSTTSEIYNPAKPELEFPTNNIILGQLLLKTQLGWDDQKISFSLPSKMPVSPHTVFCHECVEKRAECNCVQCQAPYCSKCFNRVHQSARAFKDHICTDLVNTDCTNIEVKCLVHKEQNKQFWCDLCSVAVCSKCLISMHNGHTISLLTDKNVNCFKDLLSSHVNVSNVQTRLKATKKKALNNLSKYERMECKGAEKEVREHFSRLHGLLLAKENKLLAKIYSPHRGSANSLKNMIQQIDSSIEDLEQMLSVSSALIENDMKYLNCASYFDVVEKLHSKENLPCFLLISSEIQDTSKFVYDSGIFKILEEHGNIDVTNDVSMYRLVSEDELPPDYSIDPIKSLSIDSLKKFGSLALGCNSGSGSSVSPSTSIGSLTSASCNEPLGTPSNSENIPESANVECGNRNFDELVEGCKVKVILTHAASPSDFYVRRIGTEKKLNEINQAFSMCTPSFKTPGRDRIKPGNFFMAQFSQDLKWYRSVALEVADNLITVFYIDFGNTETVKRENLRVMPQNLMKYDGMAVHCCLHDCRPVKSDWTPQTIPTMLKILENGELSIIIRKKLPELLSVEFLRVDRMDSVNLGEALIFLGFARNADSNSSSFKVETVLNQRQLPSSISLANGHVMEVVLSHIVNPYEFYVQDVNNYGSLQYITKALHSMYARRSERMTVYHPKIDMIVAVMHSENNQWRRAKIISVPGLKKVEVSYLDFGDTEVIPYKRVRYLGSALFDFNPQCIRCRLIDVTPLEGETEWSGLALEKFAALLQDDILVASGQFRFRLVIQSKEEDHYCTVLFKEQGSSTLCINTALVKESVALSTGPNSTILHLPSDVQENNPSNQVCKNVMKSESNIKNSPYNSKKVNTPQLQLQQILPLFDPVNENKLKHLATEHIYQSTPNLSQEDNNRQSGQFLGSTSSLFLPVKGKGASSPKSCGIPPPRPLTAKVKDFSSTADCSTAPSKSTDCIKIPVHIVKIISPSEFYITPVSVTHKLKHLKNEMQKFYSKKCDDSLRLKDFSLNTVCVVKREPKEWCRACIIEIDESTVKVSLPDFGGEIEVNKDSVYMIKSEFKELRDGATRCHLGGIKQPLDDRWPMTSTDEMSEFSEKYEGKIYITKLGEERANSLPVEVLIKEEVAAGALEPTKVTWTSLNNNLRMRGLALSDGTIDWDVEDFKFQTVQQQKSRLQVDVFKGIPIKYAGVADSSQVDLLDDISNSVSIFGSTIKLSEGDDDGTNLEGSISKLSITDSLNTTSEDSTSNKAAENQASEDDESSIRSEVIAPQAVLPLPHPVMPKCWPPPLPFTKMEFIANPTNVNYKAAIFLQDFQKSISSLKRLCEILDSYCRMTLPMPHDMYWSVNQTCIARYHLDNKWYRGVVKSIKDDNTFMVELVDYGNIEECTVRDLRKIPLATDIPIQGQFCKVNKIKPNTADGEWTVPVLDTMHSLVVEKHCLVKLSYDSFEQSYCIESVKLPDGSEMLGYLVKKGLAVFYEPHSQNPSIYATPESTDANNKSKVEEEDNQVHSESRSDCEVLSSTNIDSFTNPETSDVMQNNSCEISKIQYESWAAECEAYEARENAKKLHEKMNSQEQAGLQYDAKMLKQMNITKQSKLQESSLSIDDETQFLVGQESEDPCALYDMNPSCLSEDINADEPEFSYLYLGIPDSLQRFEVEVGALLGGDSVVFQIVSSDDLKINHSRERFLELTDELQLEAPQQPCIHFPRENDICCAKYTLDDLWYRAQILQVIDDEHVVVKYVDYGNCEKLPITQLREMKELWTMIEVQALDAKLHNIVIPDVQNNKSKILYELKEALFDCKLTAIVFDREPWLSVELYDGGKLAYQSAIDAGLLRLLEE